MANLGSLVATITANTKPFQQGMRRAKGSLGGFQEQTSKFNMRGMIAKLGLAAAAFAGMRAAVAQVKQQLTDLDNLGKTADKLGLGVQQFGVNRVAGERLQGQRRDEFLRAPGHHDSHIGAALLELADELCRFVGGDAAADAEHNIAIEKMCHCGYPTGTIGCFQRRTIPSRQVF